MGMSMTLLMSSLQQPLVRILSHANQTTPLLPPVSYARLQMATYLLLSAC